MSPTINVYLTESEYVQLATWAIDENTKASLLVRRAVQKFLKQKETS